jgi:hypothetical protein
MRYLLMISLLLPAMATADEQRIGFVAGSTHGVGLGYSKQFKDGRGWQVSALPIVERRWKQFAISLELPLAVQAGYHNHEFKFLGMHPIPNFSLMYFW